MVKKASLRADAPVTLKPPPAPPRRSSRHTSVADPGSSSDNTPEKGQNPSIASTPKPPSTLTKQAPSQRHDRAQSSVSRVATTDDDDQQEESRLDTDDDQQDSNNHTELTTDEMRVQVFAKWFCAPEQVIPHNLIQPKKRGLTFNASLVAILHQICALDVDLAVAQEALEEAVKQDEQNFLGYEQLETALTKAFDLKNGKLKPASGEDSEGQPSEGPVGDDDEEAGASKDDAEEDAANSGATTHGKVDHGDHQSTKKGDKSRLKGNNPADKRKSTEAPADQGPPKKKHRANSKNGPKDGSGDGDDMPQRPEKDPAKKANVKAPRPKDALYRLGPSDDQMLKGKGILWADLDEDGQNGTAEELVQAYRHHIPFCIQVKGQRYTFRMVRGADDLADWAEHEKGEPDPANPRDREAPAIDELVPAMLSHVSHGINLRSQIEGSYKRITEADAAEDTFVKAVYGAYDKYVRELKKRGLYPI